MADNENKTEEKIEEQQKNNNDELQTKQIELDELNDRYKRLFAEFENYKKRTQKESLSKRTEITADVVTAILPVVDNLEKAIEVKIENNSYQEGIKLILRDNYLMF